jgi:putative selenate reductase
MNGRTVSGWLLCFAYMSDRFHPVSMEQLTAWVFTELKEKDSLFGVPRSAFFVPHTDDRFRLEKYGWLLESPFGVAAGPHSQMAQNLLVAWACGARFLELKTVQTLDELEVNKPCIDLEDEGYNVEWSQELKVYESFDEYLRAWILIHALHHKLGYPGQRPGVIFNMSVGYNLEGILRPNVQWFLDSMRDSSAYKQQYIDVVAEWYPEVRAIEIPDQISDSITLSTMHGCPPDEIEKISSYLLAERGLHTSVKCNPTLLGPERVRSIVNDDLGYLDVPIPDEAFGHDLKYADAVPMLRRLDTLARENERIFGVKLTNTLEVKNFRTVFPQDETMYLSGRALHAVTANLASLLAEEFEGKLLISFAGGADCFNVSQLLSAGVVSVTVCSDLLKSGGYMRMLQYFEMLNAALDEVGATDLEDFVVKTAMAHGESPANEQRALVLANLRRYAESTLHAWPLQKASLRTDRSKTSRSLGLFDCIEAPCVDECPVDQKVPQYMTAVRRGDFEKAVALTREDNPLPTILGRVCDHLCENTCIRTHYDEPLAIRDIKRFIMAQEESPTLFDRNPPMGRKVAILGAGPAGLAAAQELAYAGIEVTIFEMYPYAGGMVGGAIPTYRLPQREINQDLAVLDALGVEIRYGMQAGVDFSLDDLRREGFESVFVAVGAQIAKRLNLPGEDAEGVLDALRFLRSVREGEPVPIGRRVGVIGAGDTAMDCVRSAYRLGSEVSLIYRRTIDQMPADREEIRGAIEEGVNIVELAKPIALKVEEGRLVGVVCRQMEYRGERDAAGRKVPHDIEKTELEIPLDTLILAISQHSLLDFFADNPPELTEHGYICVDATTLATTLPGVFAGGDVAAEGPSSIVRAAADGKRAAASIIERLGQRTFAQGIEPEAFDLSQLLGRRAHRQWRVPATHTPLEERRSFNETVLTYSAEEAMEEAGRCLDCHQICSLCVGVCPNLALMTYESTPLRVRLPVFRVTGEQVEVIGEREFRIDQQHQIAVLTDFCNECGNCTTFCPTSGEPYRDKPRLYLNRPDFEAEMENAFMLLRDGNTLAIEARWFGETHRLTLGEALHYESPSLRARLDPESFEVIEIARGSGCMESRVVDLEPCASMYHVARSLDDSMPQIPWVASSDSLTGVTRVAHPGYEE